MSGRKDSKSKSSSRAIENTKQKVVRRKATGKGTFVRKRVKAARPFLSNDLGQRRRGRQLAKTDGGDDGDDGEDKRNFNMVDLIFMRIANVFATYVEVGIPHS